MLFNSYGFLFVFLPALLLLAALARGNVVLYKLVLIGGSLLFYAQSSMFNIGLFLCSVVVTYAIAGGMAHSRSDAAKTAYLAAGILINLANLFYFKYLDFFASLLGVSPAATVNVWTVARGGIVDTVALPLAISFYTFEQIYFLLDAYRRKEDSRSLIDYLTFITFFPKLLAGPVIRPSSIIDQLKALNPGQTNAYFETGLMIFLVALAKKTIVADGLVRIIDPVFRDKATVMAMTAIELWCFALLGALQIYFDYSAYCDMAVGIGLMFGLVLPMNFNSPLRTRNFVEFWRCWNITLTNFFTETIFYPVSLYFARRKPFADNATVQYVSTVVVPIFLTFFVAGIWHGAGFNFIYFGLMNAIGIIVVRLLQKAGVRPLPFWAAYTLNMLYAAVALLCFRETDIGVLNAMLVRMFTFSRGYFSWNFSHGEMIVLGTTLVAGYAFVLFMPNIIEIFARDVLGLKHRPSWLEPMLRNAYGTSLGRVALAVVTFLSLVSVLNPTFFVYFQF